ncbi:hypothetical protein FA15DRAFT_697588 [Coprinopsis marcescibilis]|uniref:Uncharacterized protein n=1 Tax=Coprinopsis marcescibilis TaxID=230819 RepID=A0A5C3KGS3_COPMA|nr:hypothetical protein FA15DRAFT_697588 [Coprinopsis marcescibilis]
MSIRVLTAVLVAATVLQTASALPCMRGASRGRAEKRDIAITEGLETRAEGIEAAATLEARALPEQVEVRSLAVEPLQVDARELPESIFDLDAREIDDIVEELQARFLDIDLEDLAERDFFDDLSEREFIDDLLEEREFYEIMDELD